MISILLLFFTQVAQANLYSRHIYVIDGIAYAEEVNLVDGKAVTTTKRVQDGQAVDPSTLTNGLRPMSPAIIAPAVGSAQPAYPNAIILPPHMAYPQAMNEAFKNTAQNLVITPNGTLQSAPVFPIQQPAAQIAIPNTGITRNSDEKSAH